MARIVSINQPAYLPWLGYFHRIHVSDLHIVLDHVQFEKNSVSNRNRVRTATGWCWLTVPLRTRGRFGELALHQVELAETERWPRKHWSTLCQLYGKAPFFANHAGALEALYHRPWRRLGDLTREFSGYQLKVLGIRTPLMYSSAMAVSGSKAELVLNLCRSVGATVYLSGPLGREYLTPEPFAEAGIRIEYHDYQHPTYPQAYPGFEPYMAALDLLFSCGPESLTILSHGNLTRNSLLSESAAP